MNAVVIEKPGGPRVLTVRKRTVPMPRAGEILVKVHAAGVNRPDVPPCTRNVSPAFRPPRWKTLCHTVKKVSGSAAASASEKPVGIGRAWSAGVKQYSA